MSEATPTPKGEGALAGLYHPENAQSYTVARIDRLEREVKDLRHQLAEMNAKIVTRHMLTRLGGL